MYAALIANHVDVKVMEEWSKTLWTSEIMHGYTENLKASKDGSLRFNERSGLVDDIVMNKKLQEIYGEWKFSDLRLPFKIVATDLFAGEKVFLSEGSVFDAIRASLAIPIIFPPWEVNGRLLIDSAVTDPLPIDVAIQDGADIIAMGFQLDYRNRFCSMTAVQEQLNSIYMNNILNSRYAFYNLAHHAEIFPIIPEFDGTVSMLAARAGREAGISTATDVTGFGLVGHLLEVLEGSGLTAELRHADIPVFAGIRDLMSRKRIGSIAGDRKFPGSEWLHGAFGQPPVPGGARENMAHQFGRVRLPPRFPVEEAMLLADPQTSGGLLMFVPSDRADRLCHALLRCGEGAWRIGKTHPGGSLDVQRVTVV